MDPVIFQLGFFLLLILFGFFTGTYLEKKHYQSIESRETSFLSIPTVNMKKGLPEDVEVKESYLVSGSVVVSIDYFKRILAGLRALVGGEVSAYETLVDRARREATLRMKESAGNPDMFLNLRIETSSISKSTGDNRVGSVEAFAYATAIKLIK